MHKCEEGSAKQERRLLLNRASSIDPPGEEVLRLSFDTLDEDVYGACITVLVRDSYDMCRQDHSTFFLHASRMVLSLCLLLFMVFLQSFLIIQMKRLVSSQAVHEIREAYGHFEEVMYGSDPAHLVNTSHGHARGASSAFYDVARFDQLTEREKSTVCQFPLSQPALLLPTILIWSLTITNDLRRTVIIMTRLLHSTPTVASMAEAQRPRDGDPCAVEVVGLTLRVKACLTALVFAPRLAIDGVMLWLGCRWLVATPGFTDLLLNAVALEFILLLKDTLYGSVVPRRTKRTLGDTLIKPYIKKEAASYRVFLGGFTYFLAAVAWTLLYTFRWQNVLPDYRWDVRPACERYIAQITNA